MEHAENVRPDPGAPADRAVLEGQAAYTRASLNYYRFFVLGFSNRFAWRCSTRSLLRHHDRHVGAAHLDVGVGTGYYVAHGRYPVATPRLGLMDINPNSLAYAADAARAHRPETYRHNVLEPFTGAVDPFDSIGVTYLLHCLPGTMAEKAVVFDHLTGLLAPGGTVFGATVLAAADGGHNLVARYLLREYNDRGHFHNTTDRLDVLRRELASRFADVDVRRRGSVALFTARRPHAGTRPSGRNA